MSPLALCAGLDYIANMGAAFDEYHITGPNFKTDPIKITLRHSGGLMLPGKPVSNFSAYPAERIHVFSVV